MENDDDEVERELRRKKWVRWYHTLGNKIMQEVRDLDVSNYYILDGMYHNGVTAVPVQMIGCDLHDCVSKLKKADPNFGLHEMSFTGGWVCADYDVTRQVRDVI